MWLLGPYKFVLPVRERLEFHSAHLVAATVVDRRVLHHLRKRGGDDHVVLIVRDFIDVGELDVRRIVDDLRLLDIRRGGRSAG